MKNFDLGITKGSKIIHFWLGSWIDSLSEDSSSVKIKKKSDGVIELQDENGHPNCMIYKSKNGVYVFTLASIPLGKKHSVPKNCDEMEAAYYFAIEKEKKTKFYKNFFNWSIFIYIGMLLTLISYIL